MYVFTQSVGKSTFLRYLEGCAFNERENVSTNGLKVATLQFPPATHRLSWGLSWMFQSSKPKEPAVTFQVLDLGGQEIFQTTHRFFMTTSAIYVVMYDVSVSSSLERARYVDIHTLKRPRTSHTHQTRLLMRIRLR